MPSTVPGLGMPKGGLYAAKSVRPFRVQSDPRPSGPLCICGCGRERTKVAVAHEDPFATTECCRAWYGED
jgi:hypothetical protein